MISAIIRKAVCCLFLVCQTVFLFAQSGQPGPYTFTGKINHTRTFVPVIPSTDTAFVKNSARTTEQVNVTTDYADGFGRHLQTVTRQITTDAGSSARRDLVVAYTYDEFGRQSRGYLPYAAPSGSSNGDFRSNPFQEQSNFWAALYAGEGNFFREQEMEYSPLSRVRKGYAEGNAFARSAGNKYAEGQYLANAAFDSVVIWKIGTGRIPVYGGYYPVGFLFKKVTIDANGNKIQEFRNRDNQLVLLKIEKNTGAQGGYKDWLCTYSVYDDLGLLRFEISPKAVDAVKSNWTISAAVANELCFVYSYDSRNRQIVTKAPGVDSVEVVYDSRDRTALMRDGKLRAASKWSIIFYDELNRPLMSGLYNSAASREILQNAIDAGDGYTTLSYTIPGQADLVTAQHDGRTLYEASNSITFTDGFETGTGDTEARINGALAGTVQTIVSNNTLPGISMNDVDPLNYQYYDNYDFAGSQAMKAGDLAKLVTAGSSHAEPASGYYPIVRGSATGMKFRVLDSDVWLTSTTYYDARGRAIQALAESVTGGEDVSSVMYDFSGRVLSNYKSHVNPQSAPEKLKGVLYVFNRDFSGRVTSTQLGLDTAGTIALKTIVNAEFNVLGQLNTRQLGVTGGVALETQAFEYNINGALLGMNRGYLKGQTNNYFGYELAYEQTGSAVTGSTYQHAQYNGNVTGVTWKGSSDGINRKYDFTYDPVNRLLKADFNQQDGNAWGKSLVDFSVRLGDGLHADSAYDPNGNILSMLQMGLKNGSKATIDDLHYIYQAGTNRLSAVWDGANDVASNLGDFKEPAANGNLNKTGTADYDYDNDGNLIRDINKGIGLIEYNFLGLPKKVHVPGKGQIAYTYDALGRKLVRTLTDSSVNPVRITTTHYQEGYVYKNDSLRIAGHNAGRVRAVYNAGQQTGYVFDYFVSDHMGNTRVVLTEQQDFSMYAATMEVESTQVETALFSNVEETRAALPVGYPSDATTRRNAYVAKLNAKNPARRIGPSLVLKITAGDSVQVAVRAFYKSEGPKDKQNMGPAPDMIAALATAFANGGTPAAGKEQSLQTATPFNGNFTGEQYSRLKKKQPGGEVSSRPKAYLNYVFFDEQFNLVEEVSGVKQVTEQPDALQLLVNDQVRASKSGYLYVYTSNETQQDVYFDNLIVMTTSSPVLEESHYYPFGLEMAGISGKAFTEGPYTANKYKFNAGSELNEDLGLNWYETPHRTYDMQLGRFLQVDPIASQYPDLSPYSFAYNNPISSNDPSGLSGTIPAFKNAQELIDYLWDNTPNHGYTHFEQDNHGGWMQFSGLISTPLAKTELGGKGGSALSFTIGAFFLHGEDADAAYESYGAAGIMGNFTQVNILLTTLQDIATHVDREHTLDNIQTALDIAGNIPVFGEVFDVANAVIYFSRGDKLNGMLSLSSTIPIVGNAISETRLVSKVARNIPIKASSKVVSAAGELSELQNVEWAIGAFRSGNNVFVTWASRIKPIDGVMDVIGHGTTHTIHDGARHVRYRELAALIKQHPEFKGKKAIRLISCRTGQRADGIAQKLANELGVPVYAPNDLIAVDRYGNWGIGTGIDDDFSSGKFLPFRPKGK